MEITLCTQPSYHLRMLGSFQLISNEKEIRFRSKRIVALLSHLICLQRPVSRTTLAELIWPEKCEKVGRTNVRWAINQISKNLPNALSTNRDTVEFIGTPHIQIDILNLEKAVSQSDVETLETTLYRCQGKLLDGFFFDESADFEAWLERTRQIWWHKIQQGAIDFITHQLQQRNALKGLDIARHLLSLESAQETIHQLAIQALIQLERYDEALTQFEQCRQGLQTELGVEPDVKTVELYKRLLKTKTQRV